MGVASNHQFFHGIFPHKPSHFRVSSIETAMILTSVPKKVELLTFGSQLSQLSETPGFCIFFHCAGLVGSGQDHIVHHAQQERRASHTEGHFRGVQGEGHFQVTAIQLQVKAVLTMGYPVIFLIKPPFRSGIFKACLITRGYPWGNHGAIAIGYFFLCPVIMTLLQIL